MVRSFPRDDRGASLVEYALLVALIALVCFGAAQFLGASAAGTLDRNSTSLFTPTPTP